MSCKPGVTRQGGVAAFLAALLLVVSGLFAGSALAGPDKQPDATPNDHPSGKDRTEEPGGSQAQGRSTSDPDGDANGGADKPGGDGGFDADKDGNNGCGNDDDFEDDNNGNCGGLRVQGEDARDVQGEDDVRKVQGNGAHRKLGDDDLDAGADAAKSVQGAPSQLPAVQAVEDTQVLGVAFTRESPEAAVSGVGATTAAQAQGAPAALAATGAPAVELVAVALVLIASGLALVASARRRETSLV